MHVGEGVSHPYLVLSCRIGIKQIFIVKIAVIIPAYKVKKHVLSVIDRIGPEVSGIYVVDDFCPEHSGAYVQAQSMDPRLVVLRNEVNKGVGGAVMAGYKAALADGYDVMVKIDGDGQMDPALLPTFVAPIISGRADYAKGNRFFDLEQVKCMPKMRLFGNACLSFMTKLSSGYWDIFDPTNGYTAIHRAVALRLPLHKLSQRYFFETDMLFRLNTLRAVVIDVPMGANYGDEVSNLKISSIVGEFLGKHCSNFVKRIFYNYYLRDMSLASIELPLGMMLLVGGSTFGLKEWFSGVARGVPTTAGTVMLAALPIILGIQLVLAFLGYDIANVPRRPFQFFSMDKK